MWRAVGGLGEAASGSASLFPEDEGHNPTILAATTPIGMLLLLKLCLLWATGVYNYSLLARIYYYYYYYY